MAQTRKQDERLAKPDRRAALQQGAKLAYTTPLVLAAISGAKHPDFAISRHGKGGKPSKPPFQPPFKPHK